MTIKMLLSPEYVGRLPHRYRLILALFGMARPMQLVAVTLVYTLGTFIALAMSVSFDLSTCLWAYVALIPTSMSIHYANEYADYETDALTERTPFSGGSGALALTHLKRTVALKAAFATLVGGLMVWTLGLYMGYIPLSSGIILISGAFGGWMYSLPPLKLAWRGWGELDNAMLGGMALPLYGYSVQAGKIEGSTILATVPFALLVFINLLATTWPDRIADAQVGKFTLATRFQPWLLRSLYMMGGILPFLLLLEIPSTIIPAKVAVYSFASAPLVLIGALTYTRIRTPLPTVAAMISMLAAQLAAWACISGY